MNFTQRLPNLILFARIGPTLPQLRREGSLSVKPTGKQAFFPKGGTLGQRNYTPGKSTCVSLGNRVWVIWRQDKSPLTVAQRLFTEQVLTVQWGNVATTGGKTITTKLGTKMDNRFSELSSKSSQGYTWLIFCSRKPWLVASGDKALLDVRRAACSTPPSRGKNVRQREESNEHVRFLASGNCWVFCHETPAYQGIK